METVDARGLSCPEPMLRTKRALSTMTPDETLEVLVETVTSRENVRRMATSKGYTVEILVLDEGFKLVISRS